jgi:glycosyltransferase involved in cell wall biosynthesis
MNIWYFCMDSHIASGTDQYAPSIHMLETIHALRSQGHEVCSYFAGDKDLQQRASMQRAYRRLDANSRLLAWSKAMVRDLHELYQNLPEGRQIEPLFRNNRIDLVYERLSQNKSSVSACARRHHLPLFIESNAPAEERKQYWGAPLDLLTRRMEVNVLKRADAVLVVSSPLKRHYEKLGIPANKIFVLPNGVNMERFSPGKTSRNVRAELGLEDRVVIGFVGNIRKYHGIELLPPLARLFRTSADKLHFLILGGEATGNLSKGALAAEGLDDLFSFIGPVPNSAVPDYIAAMDVCVLPQFMWYGSPMKILEYGAMGKAIVAPDMENIRDLLIHGKTGFLFDPSDASALAHAIQTVSSDSDLRQQLGAAARAHILAHHTWSTNAERILKIYSQVTSNAA